METNICYLYWLAATIFLYYYVKDVVKNWRSSKIYPIAGDYSPLIPRFILSIILAFKTQEICQYSYRKYKDRAVQFIRSDGNVLALPFSVVDELASLPISVASSSEGLENELMGKYTSMSLILDNHLHHSIVQRRLTPRIPMLVPLIEKSVSTAFDTCFPKADDWVELVPYEVFKKISPRINQPALVGIKFSEDPDWLDVALNYSEQLVLTTFVLRTLPRWMQPLVAPFLPSYWKGRHAVQKAQAMLYPEIQKLIGANDSGEWDPTNSTEEQDMNILSWPSGTIKGNDRNPATIVHVQILLAFASTHTSLSRIVSTLYDIMAAGPSLTSELLAEIETVAVGPRRWTEMPHDHLPKLESVLRESQRVSPTASLGMKRLFKEPYTFHNGIHVPAGTLTTMMVTDIENDPELTPNPEVFDGLRFYREKQNLGLDTRAAKELDFAAATETALGFGHGRSACPGRYFASLTLKMVFIKLLTEYDFKFLPGEGKPEAISFHDFLVTSPTRKILVRRKPGGVCPF
ncbi:cytochrome P450 [Xylariaceae sp. FL0255]|nr:cytochrome P450 [Xylariaceae sp. FL0255]